MFKVALKSVLHSPMAFFDTTPIGEFGTLCCWIALMVCGPGRILSRLSKDQDILDNELYLTQYQILSTFSSVLGTVSHPIFRQVISTHQD